MTRPICGALHMRWVILAERRGTELGSNVPGGCLFESDCSLIDQQRAAAARLRIEWACRNRDS